MTRFSFSVGNILSRNKEFWVFLAENMKRPLFYFYLFFECFFRVLEKTGNP